MARRYLDLYTVRKVEERPKNIPVETIQAPQEPQSAEQQRFNEAISSQRPEVPEQIDREATPHSDQQTFQEAIPFAAYPAMSGSLAPVEAERTGASRVTLFDLGLYASGLWLLVAPSLLHFHAARSFLISTAIIGVCLLAVAVAYTFRLIGNNLFALLSLVAGVALLGMPLLFSAGSDSALWNSIILGYVVLGITLLTLLTTDSEEI